MSQTRIILWQRFHRNIMCNYWIILAVLFGTCSTPIVTINGLNFGLFFIKSLYIGYATLMFNIQGVHNYFFSSILGRNKSIFKDAAYHLEKALEINPNDAEAHQCYSQVVKKLKQQK
eukprot:56752_1